MRSHKLLKSLIFIVQAISFDVLVLVDLTASAVTNPYEFLSFPEVGERGYTIPTDPSIDSYSKPTTIMPLDNSGRTDLFLLKDPIIDRDIKVKQIIGGSRYITAVDLMEEPPKVETAFVTITPMAIMGKSNEPSLKLKIREEKVSTSDAVRAPDLVNGIYRDAEKLK